MLELNDVSDKLLIVPQRTIEILLKLDNGADCLALYIFYYKTAKWQKTNQIKASDAYVLKSLGWGKKKLATAKEALKEKGLIAIVQQRSEGKIDGWYIKVNYIVSSKATQRIVEDVNIKKYQKQQVAGATSSFWPTNALIITIICLLNTIEMLKENKLAIANDNKVEYGNQQINELFDVWEESFKYKPRNTKANRYAAYNLLRSKDIGFERARGIIKALPALQAKPFSLREVRGVSDFVKLQENWDAVWNAALTEWRKQQEKNNLEDWRI